MSWHLDRSWDCPRTGLLAIHKGANESLLEDWLNECGECRRRKSRGKFGRRSDHFVARCCAAAPIALPRLLERASSRTVTSSSAAISFQRARRSAASSSTSLAVASFVAFLGRPRTRLFPRAREAASTGTAYSRSKDGAGRDATPRSAEATPCKGDANAAVLPDKALRKATRRNAFTTPPLPPRAASASRPRCAGSKRKSTWICDRVNAAVPSRALAPCNGRSARAAM